MGMQKQSRERLSRFRQSLLLLKDQPGQFFPIFLDNQPLVKGTVYPLRRRCGKPTCSCRKGELHETQVLSASVGGRTRLWSVSAERLEDLCVLTQRYQRFRSARADFVKRYTQMVKIIDAIERLRRVKP